MIVLSFRRYLFLPACGWLLVLRIVVLILAKATGGNCYRHISDTPGISLFAREKGKSRKAITWIKYQTQVIPICSERNKHYINSKYRLKVLPLNLIAPSVSTVHIILAIYIILIVKLVHNALPSNHNNNVYNGQSHLTHYSKKLIIMNVKETYHECWSDRTHSPRKMPTCNLLFNEYTFLNLDISFVSCKQVVGQLVLFVGNFFKNLFKQFILDFVFFLFSHYNAVRHGTIYFFFLMGMVCFYQEYIWCLCIV